MVRSRPRTWHGPCVRSIAAFIGIVLLPLCTGFAVGDWQNADSDFEQNLVREDLENCLKSYISAAKRAEILECPGALGASFSKNWAEFIKSDLIFLEHQTKYLILSVDLQTKNRGMDEIITLLAETRSRIETLRGIAFRFASRCPACAAHLTPLLKGDLSSSESPKGEFRCLTRSLLTNLSKSLAEAHLTQGQLRARQQDALASLAQMRSDLAAEKEQLDEARSSKQRALACLNSGPDAEKAVPAVLSHCRKRLLTAIRDGEAAGTRRTYGKLPRRFAPPVSADVALRAAMAKSATSTTHDVSSAECNLEPTLSVAPRSLVCSVAEGGVVLSEYIPGFGLTIVLRHGQRDVAVFSHLAASFVWPGDRVKSGQKIGLSGESGVAERPSLLFALVKEGKFRDPRPRIDWREP